MTIPTERERQRAAAVVLSGAKILLHRAEGDAFWALPGGEVEADETAAEALARELEEELGQTFSIGALLWSHDQMFEHQGQVFDEHAHYYSAVPVDPAFLQRSGPFAGVEGPRVLTFDWFEQRSLETLDFRPLAIRPRLQAALKAGE